MNWLDVGPILALKVEAEAAGLGMEYCSILVWQTGKKHPLFEASVKIYDPHTGRTIVRCKDRGDRLEELVVRARRIWKEVEVIQ